VYVGIAKLTLVVAESHSLKEKRMVLRRIKDRVRERLSLIVSEVGEQDNWQRAELGVAITSSDRGKALALIDDVIRVAMAAGGAEVVAVAKDVTTFDAESVPYAPIDDRTGSADKAQGQGDATWIPDEWRDDEKQVKS
jgi:uncharacterized protein YlxP (DUF503 family)